MLVVIGVGGMGLAIARRRGSGTTVLLADADEVVLRANADRLASEGHDVIVQPVDVSSRQAVASLAHQASALGPVTQLVHTAGLSPAQATSEAILRVDLIGVAFTLEEFGQVIAAGGAGVVIASMAGTFLAGVLTAEQELALACTTTDELPRLPLLSSDMIGDPGMTYALAKRANQLRVQAASVTWGERGGRVNSISPGIISTPMGRLELASATGEIMRTMTQASAMGRLGTPDDIASAAAFLLGDDASFITGTDLLVDGGVVAGQRFSPGHAPVAGP